MTWRPAAWGAVALAGAVLVGVGLAVRDVDPPAVWLEVAEGPLMAGRPFEVAVSADVPATFTLRYGDTVVEEVAEAVHTAFTALPGRHVLQVDAVAGSGLATTVARELTGWRAPQVILDAPVAVQVGDPLVAHVASTGGDAWTASIRSLALALDGTPLALQHAPDGWWAIAAVPLEAAAGPRVLELTVEDAVGGVTVTRRDVTVQVDPRPVELLQLGPASLALVTPEARDLEAATLDQAFSAVSAEPRWSEPFLLPIEGRDTSGFGVPRRYGAGGAVSFHQGADLAAPVGTAVRAANDGVVRVAGFYPVKGGLVVLDHGQGVTSLYFHQSQLDVAAGDVVVRGDVIGRVGSTGLSTGPHLHWEVRVDGVPTDPMRWVGSRYPIEGRP